MGQLIENFLELLGEGSQENKVAGGAMQVGHTGTASLPNCADFAEKVRFVKFTGYLVDPDSMKMGDTGEFFGNIGITTDNAATISENTNDTAVFPMGYFVLVGKFKLSENIPAGFIFLSLSFQVFDKTRPGTLFQLIQQWRIMLWHLCFLLSGLLILNNLTIRLSKPPVTNRFPCLNSHAQFYSALLKTVRKTIEYSFSKCRNISF